MPILQKWTTAAPRKRPERDATSDPVLSRIHPVRLVARAQRMQREDFALHYADTWMILVGVAHDSALAKGIQLTDEEPRLAHGETTGKWSASTIPPPPPRSEAEHHAAIRDMLARTAVVALPVRKRWTVQRPFANRVAIGRAANSDVVLIDDSISRFHAWFEGDGRGGFLLADAGSKNGTFVRGERLLPREYCRVSPGDEVRFGNVTATVCAPGTFWDVVAA